MHHKQFIILTIFFEKEDDGRWTAQCKELGTSTFGDSLEEAKTCIEEAMLLHLNTLEDVKERERFFKENNIEIHTELIQNEISIEVPNDPRIFSQPFIHSLLQQA